MNEETFNEQYYKSINYTDYLHRSEKYVKTAEELDWFFRQKLSLLFYDSSILDYGCAVGFLLEGFKKLGYTNLNGYEISNYAKEICYQKNLNIIENLNQKNYNFAFFLDVLEHMSQESINDLFSKCKFNYVIVRIPCSTEENKGTFHLDVSKKDKTHINCKSKQEWINIFKNYGYKNIIRINLNTIYDSEGVFCALIL
jgi:hypothetical protein